MTTTTAAATKHNVFFWTQSVGLYSIWLPQYHLLVQDVPNAQAIREAVKGLCVRGAIRYGEAEEYVFDVHRRFCWCASDLEKVYKLAPVAAYEFSERYGVFVSNPRMVNMPHCG